MFAVISHKEKQYKVEEGKKYRLDLQDEIDGGKIIFDNVLLVDDGKKVSVGTPNVVGAKVEASVIGEEKGEKVEIFKFHAKKHYQRSAGHRQKYTVVEIKSINV